MRALCAQGGVVSVAGIHHRVIAVDTEQLTADVTEKFLERSRLPGLADPAGEQAVSLGGNTLAGEAWG